MLRIFSILLFILSCTVANAQQFKVDISATTQTPGVNQQFTLIYTLKLVNGSLTNPRIIINAPNFAPFKVISQSEGNASRGFGDFGFGSGISIYEYKVVLQPTKKGSFEIEPLSFTVNNAAITSSTVPINVGEPTAEAAKKVTTNSNIFAIIELSTTKVYMGEPVVATYKVFSRYYSESATDYSFPKPKDFWAEEIKPGKQGWPATTERLNNTNYKVFTIKKELLYPQRSGEVKVPPFDMSLTVQSSFWDRGEKINIASNSPTISVTALPEPKPKEFNNLVGEFKLEASITRTQCKTDEAIDVYIKISGKGNLNNLSTPKINFPKEFEMLGDPDVKDNTSVSVNGIAGSKEFNYIIVPRIKGAYELPPIEFSYFDTKTKSYKTLRQDGFVINVEQGEKPSAASGTIGTIGKDIEMINEDIRYIKTKTILKESSQPFFGSWKFYGASALPLLLMLVVFLLKRTQEKNQSDAAYKKVQALKKAQALLKEASKQSGSEALNQLTAGIYSFLSFYFDLPLSELNREKIEEKLKEKKINETLSGKLITVLDEFEMARYAGLAKGNTEELANKTLTVLTQLSNEK
jgi:hypothetical protein